ncbi:MAG: hypothetical protein Q7S21_07830 [archaeon]|nr:hypothetical protein [archaeon]
MPRKLSKIPRPGSAERLASIKGKIRQRKGARSRELFMQLDKIMHSTNPVDIDVFIDKIKLVQSALRVVLGDVHVKINDERLDDLISKIKNSKSLNEISGAYEYAENEISSRRDLTVEKKHTMLDYYLGVILLKGTKIMEELVRIRRTQLKAMEN